MTEFNGFPKDLLKFLTELAANNNRVWFNDNKSRYHESVVNPISEFIVAMKPRLHRISRHYLADPRPNGGSMFRIYRDTRFSKDKSPYKTNAGVHFRHEAGKDAHAPGFYLHLEPESVFVGGGVWQPPNATLNKIRNSIADNVRAWARISNARKIKNAGGIQGNQLKRPPRGIDAEHVHIEDLKRKSFYVMETLPAAAIIKPDFIDRVDAAFRLSRPLNRFVCDALELPF